MFFLATMFTLKGKTPANRDSKHSFNLVVFTMQLHVNVQIYDINSICCLHIKFTAVCAIEDIKSGFKYS